MRSVIQRVSSASVVIGGTMKSSIARGLLVLLAVEEADTPEDIEWLSGKIVRLRVFDDADGVMNLSVQEAQGEILLVSQFTLFASTKKGNRPSYSRSARPEIASRSTKNSSRALRSISAVRSKQANSARTCK